LVLYKSLFFNTVWLFKKRTFRILANAIIYIISIYVLGHTQAAPPTRSVNFFHTRFFGSQPHTSWVSGSL